MVAGAKRLADRRDGIGEVDHVDLAARRHHCADRPVAEAHHAGDHFLLAGFEHAGIFGFHDQRADFILGHGLGGFAALAEQIKHCLAGRIQQPHDGRRNAGDERHRRSDAHRHRFGVAQRHLFRDEFADDQRGVGDQRDHDADTGCVRDAFAQARLDQPRRKALAERRAGKRAGQDADQGDADLDGGEEAAGVRGQRKRALRSMDAFLSQGRQPRGAGGHDGQFRHGEQAVDDDQDRGDPEFEG